MFYMRMMTILFCKNPEMFQKLSLIGFILSATTIADKRQACAALAKL